MKHFSQLKDITISSHSIKRKGKYVSDTIYTFDIETTSLFLIDGVWQVFNYNLPKEEYSHDEDSMMAIPYIWQFGVEDEVYYGRNFFDFEKVLKVISNPLLTKVVWIHNLQFEMQFLQNIFDNYTITNMCARDIRKPISFHIEELNIDFRCSYMLTNLSLEKASEEYTNVRKLDTLDYDSKVRTELTKLTDMEMKYCEYDIICLYNIVKYYRQRYDDAICKIPLTATSEVRKALQKRVDYFYIKKQWDLVPNNEMYLKMMTCFQGGYTHANALNSNRVFTTDSSNLLKSDKLVDSLESRDISSSYPTVMCLEQFPSTRFRKCDYDDYIEKSEKGGYCFILHVTLYGVNSRYYNNYISFNKCIDIRKESIKKLIQERHMIYDNGRIRKIDSCEMIITNVDLEIIRKNYMIQDIEYHEIFWSEARYLDYRVIRFILDLYKDKTELKGVIDKVDLYKKAKAYINSLY